MSDQIAATPDQPADGESPQTASGINIIPAVVPIQHLPAAAEAREQLFRAIASEAQAIGAVEPRGQNAQALETLARAYTLLTTRSPVLVDEKTAERVGVSGKLMDVDILADVDIL